MFPLHLLLSCLTPFQLPVEIVRPGRYYCAMSAFRFLAVMPLAAHPKIVQPFFLFLPLFRVRKREVFAVMKWPTPSIPFLNMRFSVCGCPPVVRFQGRGDLQAPLGGIYPFEITLFFTSLGAGYMRPVLWVFGYPLPFHAFTIG